MASGSTVDRFSSNLPSDAASPWPASILLATEAYVAASRNDTTATTRSRYDHTVEVTFWIADPPAVSFYTFHRTKASVSDSDTEEAELQKVSPEVAGAEGRFVLLRALFDIGDEYFMYKGHPETPSLENVPLPDDDYRLLRGLDIAILPRGDDGHYLLIALCDDDEKVDDYRLYIYSSEDATGRIKELLNPCPGVDTIAPDKVFVLRDGLLLWVDLLHGMLVCDVLQEPHHAQYIPLPEPLLGNRKKVKECQRGVRRFRDVTCVDGLIKFIEMEHREIVREITDGVPPEKPIDVRTKDALYDSDLITLIKLKPVKPQTRIERAENGWSAMTWTRKIESNCWRKGCIVDVDDILVDDSVISELLSGQRSGESESAGSLTFKNLHLAWPTLSTDGNDILYLKSYKSGVAALVAVDLAEKTLKVEAPGAHPFGIYGNVLHPCALVNHLKNTPGIKVSACQIAGSRIRKSVVDHCIKKEESSTNKQTEKAATVSSANEPNNTAIRVGEHDSYESDNKRPRLSAEEVNHAQNGTQSTVQNVLISQGHPTQINMPPQLRFNRLEQPGYSSWPHQNNPLLLPQCFNKWAGACNLVYTPMPPAPKIHSHGNYQSRWQQQLLLEQQAAPSRTFGPHQAPHQGFNNWCEARYIGNSQQHPAGNSYSYGAASGSGNYYQHR